MFLKRTFIFIFPLSATSNIFYFQVSERLQDVTAKLCLLLVSYLFLGKLCNPRINVKDEAKTTKSLNGILKNLKMS